MKKFWCFIIIAAILFCNLPSQRTMANDALEVTARSAILIDANSAKVLYAKNENEKLPIASLTKIMSMLIIFEKLENKEIALTDTVTISENAAGMGGTQLFLEPLEVRTVEELLYGTSVESANDAVTALGEYIGGSIEGFVNMMNIRAGELGLKNTMFKDACGLTDEGHYSTAADLALLSKELLSHMASHKYISTWMIDVNIGKNNDKTRTLANSNKLLKSYEGVTGIKTGYTEKAGSCLAFSATRGSVDLIGIVLSSKTGKDRNADASKILDYGFGNFQSRRLVKKGEELAEIIIKNAENQKVLLCAKDDIYILEKKGDAESEYKKEIIPVSKDVKAPVKKDTVLAQAVFVGKNEKIAVDLVTKNDVNKASFFKNFLRNLRI